MAGSRPDRSNAGEQSLKVLSAKDMAIFRLLQDQRLRKEDIGRQLGLDPHVVEIRINRMRPTLNALGFSIEAQSNNGYMAVKLDREV